MRTLISLLKFAFFLSEPFQDKQYSMTKSPNHTRSVRFRASAATPVSGIDNVVFVRSSSVADNNNDGDESVTKTSNVLHIVTASSDAWTGSRFRKTNGPTPPRP